MSYCLLPFAEPPGCTALSHCWGLKLSYPRFSSLWFSCYRLQCHLTRMDLVHPWAMRRLMAVACPPTSPAYCSHRQRHRSSPINTSKAQVTAHGKFPQVRVDLTHPKGIRILIPVACPTRRCQGSIPQCQGKLAHMATVSTCTVHILYPGELRTTLLRTQLTSRPTSAEGWRARRIAPLPLRPWPCLPLVSDWRHWTVQRARSVWQPYRRWMLRAR